MVNVGRLFKSIKGAVLTTVAVMALSPYDVVAIVTAPPPRIPLRSVAGRRRLRGFHSQEWSDSYR